MRENAIEHIKTLFRAHQELAEILPNEAFGRKLSVPSNTIGGQFWCLVGARESYTKAVSENGWVGFDCSMTSEESSDKQSVIRALIEAEREFDAKLVGVEWTNERDNFLLDLLEHETQHQGQFIRYVYGLKYKFPKSWTQRWALVE